MGQGISFSLYCNVLTFGGMLVAYLKSCGMSWGVIGFAQGVSNFSGLLGTCIFAISQKYVDVKTTALRAIWWQFFCLSVSILGVMMNSSNRLVSAWLIIAGVIPSRIGLWTFAIASTQLFQCSVPVELRGRVGGISYNQV